MGDNDLNEAYSGEAIVAEPPQIERQEFFDTDYKKLDKRSTNIQAKLKARHEAARIGYRF